MEIKKRKTLEEIIKKTRTLISDHKTELIAVSLIILLAAFLRLYKIREFIIFLGDEGRDALVVKRMIVDHKFTLLGPTASVGGFYLGPVYYYFMIPFLWVFNFDPVGPAIMVAIIGILTVGLFYWAMREWTTKTTAIIASLIFTTAPGIVSASRSSWNPNIMPFFALLAVFSVYQALSKKNNIWFLIAGIAYGVAIQSHYLGLILGPIIGVATIINLPLKKWIKPIFLELLGFLMGGSMYFAFELRHNFPNIKSVLEFILRGGNATGPRSLNLLWLYTEILRRNIESVMPHLGDYTRLTSYLLIIGLVIFIFRQRIIHHKLSIGVKVILSLTLVGLLGIGSYKGQLYPHYFGFLFPLPFIIVGFVIQDLLNNKRFKFLIILMALTLVLFNLSQQQFWGRGSNLVDQTKNVSQEVVILSDDKPFNFALISSGNSDHAYRYFLEIMSNKPTTLEEQVTEQLIVVCEEYEKACLPLGHPLWEIAGFGRAEIVRDTVVYPGIQIFQLTHHHDSQDLIGKPAPKG